MLTSAFSLESLAAPCGPLCGECCPHETFRCFITRHSFAVISVGTERQETFRAAEDYLLRFFREGSTAEKMASQAIVPEIGGARALLGFNTPSPAKQLFRYRHGHPMQPTVAASSSLAAVFDHLRGVVDVATDIILSPVGLNVAALRKQWFVPQADESLSATYSSPLDCFYYSNTPEVEYVPNCDVHVDRGLMSAVVCASVPGLAVFDPSIGDWTQLESLFEPHAHVVVFPCMDLQLVCESVGGPPVVACVHRVDKAPTPRLSFNYELRGPVGWTVEGLIGPLRSSR